MIHAASMRLVLPLALLAALGWLGMYATGDWMLGTVAIGSLVCCAIAVSVIVCSSPRR